MSFGIHTSVQQVHEEKAASATEGAGPKSDLGHGLTSMITRLVIGCKRRAVVYTWVDGEPQEPKVSSLLYHFTVSDQDGQGSVSTTFTPCSRILWPEYGVSCLPSE
jgi:hypothetical protein